MKSFRCHCGSRIYFESTQCVHCGRELAYLPWAIQMAATDGGRTRRFDALLDGSSYARCENDVERGVCNWLVEPGHDGTLCEACRLNRVIPDLSTPQNHGLWATMEAAKRRLLYSLHRLRLPIQSPELNSARLRFDIKRDQPGDQAVTGHSDGLITLNLSEAEPATREATRQDLKERYRTPLGHFRHEIGHYYWQMLVRDTAWLSPFRERFGDERADYAAALEAHYAGSTEPGEPSEEYVTAYASAHPWEDWAETFSHYIHMVDSLDTAHDFELVTQAGYASQSDDDFEGMVDSWGRLSIALNALNRSMGMPDAYPFAISGTVRNKLRLVHRVIVSAAAKTA